MGRKSLLRNNKDVLFPKSVIISHRGASTVQPESTQTANAWWLREETHRPKTSDRFIPIFPIYEPLPTSEVMGNYYTDTGWVLWGDLQLPAKIQYDREVDSTTIICSVCQKSAKSDNKNLSDPIVPTETTLLLKALPTPFWQSGVMSQQNILCAISFNLAILYENTKHHLEIWTNSHYYIMSKTHALPQHRNRLKMHRRRKGKSNISKNSSTFKNKRGLLEFSKYLGCEELYSFNSTISF